MAITASATASVSSGSAPLTVQFTDASAANDTITETGDGTTTITETGAGTTTYTEVS